MVQEPRCQAKKADGTPCLAPSSLVDPVSGFCASHDPAKRDRILAAARRGGEANRRKLQAPGLGPDELPPLESPQAAERWLEILGKAVATGRLGHHEATAIVRAVREFLRAHEAGSMADKVEELQAKVRKLKRGGLEAA